MARTRVASGIISILRGEGEEEVFLLVGCLVFESKMLVRTGWKSLPPGAWSLWLIAECVYLLLVG